MVSLSKALLGAYFLGGMALGGVPLDSHDKKPMEINDAMIHYQLVQPPIFVHEFLFRPWFLWQAVVFFTHDVVMPE